MGGAGTQGLGLRVEGLHEGFPAQVQNAFVIRILLHVGGCAKGFPNAKVWSLVSSFG